MKSGFNFPDHPKEYLNGRPMLNRSKKGKFATYQPSYLKNYFIEKFKMGSEKREIKEKMFRHDLRIKKDPNLTAGNRYVRAILGIAENLEFRDDRKGIVQIISKDTERVERFKSPITFKIFEDSVFILPESWADIKGKEFSFRKDNDEVKSIKVPDVNFDLSAFILDFADWFNKMAENKIKEIENLINKYPNEPKPVKQFRNCIKYVKFEKLSKQS